MATIYLQRESTYADKLRKYQVELDGTIIGEIADGENKSFNVKKGSHVICLRQAWARSPRVAFEAVEEESVRFECGNALKGVKLLFVIIYATLLSSRYLYLRQVK